MKMEMEISKIQTPNGLAAGGGGFFAAVPRTETLLRQTGGANSFSYKSTTDPEILYPRSEHNIDRPDANSTNFNTVCPPIYAFHLMCYYIALLHR